MESEVWGELDVGLTATDIHGLCESCDINVPGLRPGADEDKGKKVIGTIMAKLFRDQNALEKEFGESSVFRGGPEVP